MKRVKKNYKNWMVVKRNIHNNGIVRSIKEGEIWWAAVGENVGEQFVFKGKLENAVLVQAKPMDVTRLYQKMGEVSKGDYRKILQAYMDLIKNVP